MKSQFRTTFSERTEIAPTMFIISDELDGLRQITFSLQMIEQEDQILNLANKNEFTLWKARIFAWRNADLSRE